MTWRTKIRVAKCIINDLDEFLLINPSDTDDADVLFWCKNMVDYWKYPHVDNPEMSAVGINILAKLKELVESEPDDTDR